MPRQIGKHCTALIDAGVRVTLAEHHLLARLMQTSHEDEFAAMNRLAGLQPGPPSEDFGEIGDIGLAIAGANAKRVLFQRLAREILVKPLVLIDAGD